MIADDQPVDGKRNADELANWCEVFGFIAHAAATDEVEGLRAFGVRAVEARYATASAGKSILALRAASSSADRRQGGISGGLRVPHSLTVCCGVPVFSAVALTPPNASMMV